MTPICQTPNETISSESPEKARIQGYFDAIAVRYDFINSFLSLKVDDFWRKRSCDLLVQTSQKSILDLGIGTGKFLELFLKRKKWDKAAGLDFSAQMLEVARKNLPSTVELTRADFHQLPFEANAFDLVISAFALRSVKNRNTFLEQIHRVLAPQGKVGLLCLTRPTNPFVRLFYAPYLHFYLPIVGRLASGNQEAYEFLAQSIQHFPDPQDTASLMRKMGFEEVNVHPLTWGIATLIIGKKAK